MPTIAVVGEVVADAVLPPDGIVDGAAHLTVHPGGGPANFAVAVARLGSTARFAGRLSTGALGGAVVIALARCMMLRVQRR